MNDRRAVTVDLSALYEADETAWLEAMSSLAASGRRDEMDYQHLAEYLDDMAKRDRREVWRRLVTLQAHLLKWDCQPGYRSGSWRGTVRAQRRKLRWLLESGVLLRHAETVLTDTYAWARQRALAETGLSLDTFPAACRWSLAELLAEPQP